MVKRVKPLNDKTPKWFQDWHRDHFTPVRNRTFENRKWIYLIVAVILGAAITSNGSIDLVGRIVRACSGG